MKKLLSFFAVYFLLKCLSAQTNLNLETWGGNSMNPAEWTTLNVLAQIGTQTTFKETAAPGQGLASAKMITSYCNLCATFGVPLDTVAGIIITGDTASGVSGIPYTQTPQYLSFRYKAAPQPGDAGIVAVQLTHYDSVADSTIIVAEGIFLESATVSAWTDMLLPVQYYTTDTPDTLIIAVSSSASFIFSGSPLFGVKKIGSEFYADTFNLHFSFPCSFNDLSVTVSSTDETAPGANDGTAAATVTGGFSPYTYSWSNSSTTASITNLAPATYAVSVTDSVGCMVTGSAVVNPASCGLSISITTTDETAPGANDGTAAAVASGGTSPYSFNWSNGSFNAGITGLAPGTYTVTVTDASGCTDSSSATVNAFNCTLSVSASATAETAPGAVDGTATAAATGGSTPYSFNWSDGQATATATGLAPSTYTVTVTDAIGCIAIDTAVVDSFTCALSAMATATGETSAGASDGAASVTISGGALPYSYLWSNGGTDSTITGLSAGTYSVTVTDGNNCTATASATVDPASLCNIVITGVVISNPSCSGAADGQVSVTSTGGTGTIVFSWSDGTSGNTAYNLAAGTYSVTISDVNNCTADTAVSVTQPAPLSGVLSHTNETCAGCSDGTATVTVAGGTPPYSYTWTNGQSSPVITGLGAGIYSVFVQDANGCLFSGSDTVQPAVLEVWQAGKDETGFLIFPNPNKGKFILSVPGNQMPVKGITIVNSAGGVVERMQASENLLQAAIDLSNQPKGIYFVKIESGNGVYLKKIIFE